MLQTIEIETAPNPDAAIVWLHGLGADGHDFEPVVPEIVRRGERAWRFVFPHAPPRSVTINGGMMMRAWYDIRGFDRLSEEDEAGFLETDAAVRELIERERARGIASERIVLAGFSQGCAVTLYTGLRYPERLAGLVALSGYLPLASRLAAERSAASAAVPIFMAHGIDDPVLPIAMGRESRDVIEKLGFPVEWHQYRMPHSLSEQEIGDIRQFLFRRLPSP
jgi:phospholipase/carboxylesterase